MGFFNRRKPEPEPIPLPLKSPCEMFGHNWRDFPPFFSMEWNGEDRLGYCKIIEPYVCTMCHTRNDKILLQRKLTNYKPKEFFDYAQQLKDEYAYMLKPEAEVIDMVNDAMMVDRQKLKFWDSLHAPEAPKEKEEFEFKIPSRNNDAS